MPSRGDPRITGLGFVLVLIGRSWCSSGPLEGVTVEVLLALGLPVPPIADVAWLVASTVVGIVVGTLLTRFVPPPVTRVAMLTIAGTGATVVLVRGILTLAPP